MCGVMGFVGRPSGPLQAELSHRLATHLLSETVSRGSHATGVYALKPPKEGSTRYRVSIYKLDVPSPQYVKTGFWNGLYQGGYPFLLLGHCRFYTHGSPRNHINNHPHFSDDKKLALIHNGVVGGYEGLKEKYRPRGECDSEVLLRMVESAPKVEEGIQKIFLEANRGAMACLMAHYGGPSTSQIYLYAFRNGFNPLVMIDLREQLGQIFLASTRAIAKASMKNSAMPPEICQAKVVDIPPHQICKITADAREIQFIPVSLLESDPLERALHLERVYTRDSILVGGGASVSFRTDRKILTPGWGDEDTEAGGLARFPYLHLGEKEADPGEDDG